MLLLARRAFASANFSHAPCVQAVTKSSISDCFKLFVVQRARSCNATIRFPLEAGSEPAVCQGLPGLLGS